MTEPEFNWWEGGAGAMLDQIICSCGWESATFFDGREYAHAQWKRHVEADHTPDRCQCAGCCRLGMRGNENRIDGRILCDYCAFPTGKTP